MFDLFFNRRHFFKRTAGAAVAVGLAESVDLASLDLADRGFAAEPKDLWGLVDPRLRPVPPAVPDSENARLIFEAATKRMTAIPDGSFDVSECFRPDKPDAERDRLVANWLDENQHVYAEVEKAVASGRFEYPSGDWVNDRLDQLMRTRDLVRYVQFRSLQLLAQGKTIEAATYACTMADAFRLQRRAGGFLVEYLVTGIGEACAEDAMRRIALNPKTDIETIRHMMGHLPPRNDTDDLSKMVRAEYSQFFFPQLIKADVRDTAKAVEVFMGWEESFEEFVPRKTYEDNLRKILKILEGHPKPYDLADTIRRSSAKYARTIIQLEQPWLKCKNELHESDDQELGAWPQQLLLTTLNGPELSEVTDAQLAVARDNLRRVANPLGRRVIEESGVSTGAMRRTALTNQARHDGTRLFLAVCVYARDQGNMPSTLQDLVCAKIIDSVPVDPFSDKPFQYSREQKAIWSVGPERNVSPEAAKDGSDFTMENYVWRLDGIAC